MQCVFRKQSSYLQLFEDKLHGRKENKKKGSDVLQQRSLLSYQKAYDRKVLFFVIITYPIMIQQNRKRFMVNGSHKMYDQLVHSNLCLSQVSISSQ